MLETQTNSSGKKKTGSGKIPLALAFAVAVSAASGVSYAAKPAPALNATLCNNLGGAWTSNTCTIAAGTDSVVNSNIRIGNGVTLDVRGSLTINGGVSVANSGTILVDNAAGVVPPSVPFSFHEWATGILVYGTLANSGAITVENAYDQTKPEGTVGITVSITASATDWGDPTTYVVIPGVLTNSGTIAIQNGYQTRGIENLGSMTNAASGTVAVANTGTSSVGIYNKRFGGSGFYINGTLANAGSTIISSSGDSNSGQQFGYGVYNNGQITTTGAFTINASPAFDDARGFYNGGSFTNYGTFTNDRGVYSGDVIAANWGSYNVPWGTMINYGTTNATGTFYNQLIMLNYGTITSHGTFYDETGLMINWNTFHNYGTIVGGTNKAVCIDEVATNPDATGCY